MGALNPNPLSSRSPECSNPLPPPQTSDVLTSPWHGSPELSTPSLGTIAHPGPFLIVPGPDTSLQRPKLGTNWPSSFFRDEGGMGPCPRRS